jgi:hypothetical protein
MKLYIVANKCYIRFSGRKHTHTHILVFPFSKKIFPKISRKKIVLGEIWLQFETIFSSGAVSLPVFNKKFRNMTLNLCLKWFANNDTSKNCREKTKQTQGDTYWSPLVVYDLLSFWKLAKFWFQNFHRLHNIY